MRKDKVQPRPWKHVWNDSAMTTHIEDAEGKVVLGSMVCGVTGGRKKYTKDKQTYALITEAVNRTKL